MAIEEFTSALTTLKEHGEADLELSESTRNAYINLIKDYRAKLQAQRDAAVTLQNIGNPGNVPSARETGMRMMLNVIGPNGILSTLDKYLEYLDEFEATVNAAFKRMQAEDS